jgi:hypothetical protein
MRSACDGPIVACCYVYAQPPIPVRPPCALPVQLVLGGPGVEYGECRDMLSASDPGAASRPLRA